MSGVHKRNRISNLPLREPVLNSSKSLSQIVRELGGTPRAGGSMDTSGIQRMLGLRTSPGNTKNGRQYSASLTSTINVDLAKKICRIIDQDFDVLYGDDFPAQQPAAHCKTCGDPMLRRVPGGQCGFCEAELEEFGYVDVLVAA